MNRHALIAMLAFALPLAASATEWTGTGEFGLVVSRGNADVDTLNAKLSAKHEDERSLQDLYALGLHSAVDGNATAERYELGGKSGYKFNEHNYIVAVGRYENDGFSPYDYQATLSAGYGSQAIKSDTTQLSFEIGPGYRRSQAADGSSNASDSQLIGRSFVDFKHKLTANTDLIDTLLVESSAANTFAQNDLGLQVKMSPALALKAALQVRHNSDVTPTVKQTDTLTTINVVYGF